MKQNLIIIQYPLMEYDMDTIKAIAKHLYEYHSDHEFILIPDDLKYEVIKNDIYNKNLENDGQF